MTPTLSKLSDIFFCTLHKFHYCIIDNKLQHKQENKYFFKELFRSFIESAFNQTSRIKNNEDTSNVKHYMCATRPYTFEYVLPKEYNKNVYCMINPLQV